VCPDFFVTVGAFFFRARGVVGMSRLHRILRRPPRRQAAT